MKNRKIVFGGLGFLVLVAAAAIWSGNRGGENPTTAVDGVAEPVQQPAMMAHIDPATGEVVEAPAGAVTLDVGGANAWSHDGLELVTSPVTGVGEGFHTYGRFQAAVVVTTDAESVKVECVHAAQTEATEVGGER